MIGRVYRGADPAGLMRYLYGPGRHNEHENPRLVASWCGNDPAALGRLQPPEAGGVFDVRGLTERLSLPLGLLDNDDRPRERAAGGGVAVATRAARLRGGTAAPVWHCALRAAPGDRILTDSEWGSVAGDLLDRVGIATRTDDGGCRWAAVRHDDDSIHVVAVLAREDGRPARLYRDFPKVRAACLAAEQTYGLASTAPADGTAAPRATRAETEKATRTGQVMPARDLLHRQVRAEAAAARSTGELFERLRGRGVLVRQRHSTRAGHEQEVTGYAVGLPTSTDAEGKAIYFGGSKLAADLGLPTLRERYGESAGPVGPAPPVAAEQMSAGRRNVQLAAVGTAAGVGERVLAGMPADRDAAGLLAACSDGLQAAARSAEGTRGGPLSDAAAAYDRAARVPYEARRDQVVQRRSSAADAQLAALRLRTAARAVARAGRSTGEHDVGTTIQAVAALLALTIAVARFHEAQQRQVQAAAARQAAARLQAWRQGATGADRRQAARAAAVRSAPRLPGREEPGGRGR